jgi:hypothetical protein
MKAQELRIGNYLNWQIQSSIFQGIVTSISTRVVVIDHKSSFKADSEYEYYRLLFIPLTEEWLLKFGFEKQTAWYRFGKHAINPTIANLYEFKNIPIKEIEYVHQLQNLYFALTGEELTLQK